MAVLTELYYVSVFDDNERTGKYDRARLLNKRIYRFLGNAFNDIAIKSHDLFTDEIRERIGEEFPVLMGAMSALDEGTEDEKADDFRFIFEKAGIIVEVGSLMTVD